MSACFFCCYWIIIVTSLLGVLHACRDSLQLEAARARWCHRHRLVSPATPSRLTTGCQNSLSFCLPVKSDSCSSWRCSQSLGSPHSAVEQQQFCDRGSNNTVLSRRDRLTLTVENFHSSTLSMLFLFVSLGLAPMEEKGQNLKPMQNLVPWCFWEESESNTVCRVCTAQRNVGHECEFPSWEKNSPMQTFQDSQAVKNHQSSQLCFILN